MMVTINVPRNKLSPIFLFGFFISPAIKVTLFHASLLKIDPTIAMASAMVGSIFSSDAWNNVTFIAGEIKNPKRNIGLSLFLGTLIVTIIYVSCNLMYLSVLRSEERRVGKECI